ncbi:MAG: hypothetical protein ABI354_02030 [Candidatus Saccharimonadales bacterium]
MKEAGAEKRRDWSPSESSGHYRIYRSWQRKSDKHIERENFCHYWRVVLIWAPLRALRKPLLALVGLIAVAGIVAFTFTHFGAVLGGLAAAAALGYLVLGWFVVGQVLMDIKVPELDGKKWGWLDTKSATIKAAFVLATLPVVLAFAIVITIGSALTLFFFGLEDDYRAYSRFGRWFAGAQPSSRRPFSWIHPWLVLPVALIVYSIVFGFLVNLIVVTVLVALFLAVIFTLSYFGDKAKERAKEEARERKLQEQAAEDLQNQAIREAVTQFVLKRLFAIIHPEWMGDDQRFEQWLERYKEYCLRKYGTRYDQVAYYLHLYHVTDRYHKEYRQSPWNVDQDYNHGLSEPPQVAPKEKERFVHIKSVSSTIWDVIVLLWSVVLVKKWKICPLVELPPE